MVVLQYNSKKSDIFSFVEKFFFKKKKQKILNVSYQIIIFRWNRKVWLLKIPTETKSISAETYFHGHFEQQNFKRFRLKNDFDLFNFKTEIFFLADVSNVMQILKVIIEIDHYSTNSKYHQMMEYRSKK